MIRIAGKTMDVAGALGKIFTNKTVISFILPVMLALLLGKKIAENPMYLVSMLMMLVLLSGFWFVVYSVSKNNNYLSVVLFSLLLVSPFLSTGLAIKGHIRLNELILFISVPVFLIVTTMRREKIKFGIVDLWFVSMAASMLISVFVGYSKGVSPAYADIAYIIYLMMSWCYFRIGQQFDVNKKMLVVAVIAPILCILLFDLIQLVQDMPWGLRHIAPYYMPEGTMRRTVNDREASGFFRLSGLLGDPNCLASLVVILLALLMSWRLYVRKYDFLVKTVLFTTFVVFVLTFSRNGIIIFVISQIYLLWFAMRDGVKKVFRKTTPYFVLILLTVPFLYKFLFFQFRLFTLFARTERKGGMSDLEGRIATWTDGFQRAMDISPWWGRGAMSGEPFDESIYGSIAPHNEYISIIVYGGLVGFVLYLLFFSYMFWKSDKLIRRMRGDYRVMFLCRSIQAIIIALAVFSMADGFWYNTVVPPILMILFGVMHSFERLSDKNGSPVYA